MLDKRNIIEILDSFPFEKSQYWIVAGAALVLYNIRSNTNDIDMGCTTLLADKLQTMG